MASLHAIQGEFGNNYFEVERAIAVISVTQHIT